MSTQIGTAHVETTYGLWTRAERKAELERLRAAPPKWEGLIVVGCGGNYWYAERYLLARLHRTLAEVYLVDPDKLEQRNWGRQWVGEAVNRYKAELAERAWQRAVDSYGSRAVPVADLQARSFTGKRLDGLIVVCLPDNDQARLDTAEMCHDLALEDKAQTIAMIVAGTDVDHGQAYYGLMGQEFGWIHDWRDLHVPQGDVTDDGGRPDEGCGQHAMSNFETALCIGRCLDEVLSNEPVISEFYWREETDHQVRHHRMEVF